MKSISNFKLNRVRIMKLVTRITVLLGIAIYSTGNPDLLKYPLQVIEYLRRERVGYFECIFYDISPHAPFDTVMNDLLRSRILRYVAKYVIRGPYRPTALPKNPSLLLINLGSDAELDQLKTQRNVYKFVKLFHPATKVVVFVSNAFVKKVMRWILVTGKFYNMVFVDTTKLEVQVGSLTDLRRYSSSNLTQVEHIFEWLKRGLWGSTITYKPRKDKSVENPTFQWILATAIYLKGDTREFRKQEGGPVEADIEVLSDVAVDVVDDFNRVFITYPMTSSVLVPRGRLLNALEVMLMPFEWHVWTLLVAIFVLAELVKQFVPDLFRNDPILFVICGFERHHHQAGRWERTILLSLVVLMFFMTNAFETKIISYIIEKPSAASAWCLEDFEEFGLSFRYNLDKNPYVVSHPVIGNYVIHDPQHYAIWHNQPGVAQFVTQELAAIVPQLSYDFTRGKSWYVELDERFLIYTVKFHYTAFRSQFLEAFQFTQVALREAGLLDWWAWQYGHSMILKVWGLRPRETLDGPTYLVFENMLLAWIVLAIGYGTSLVGFFGELTQNKINTCLKRFEPFTHFSK